MVNQINSTLTVAVRAAATIFAACPVLAGRPSSSPSPSYRTNDTARTRRPRCPAGDPQGLLPVLLAPAGYEIGSGFGRAFSDEPFSQFAAWCGAAVFIDAQSAILRHN